VTQLSLRENVQLISIWISTDQPTHGLSLLGRV
jgi:hypothetical protein